MIAKRSRHRVGELYGSFIGECLPLEIVTDPELKSAGKVDRR